MGTGPRMTRQEGRGGHAACLEERKQDTNMSIALYQLRLYWDGHQGAVRNGNDTQILVEPPLLDGTAQAGYECIDYAPEVDVAQVREHDGDWREMTVEEVAAAEAYLASLAARSKREDWAHEHAA